MNSRLRSGIFICLLVVTSLAASAQSDQDPDRLKWFKDAKFGMFIHWGLYAQLAGQWKDTNYYGSGEWLMERVKIPAAEYAKQAATFNPSKFNADQWAAIAKNAGVKYMVITAKHHEGFSMYGSRVSPFNIVDATPFKRDPMKELSAACRKSGLRFGFYYSQFLDWHEPNGGGNEWDFDPAKKQYQQYYREKSIPQVKELLTQYGPLGILWFDMPGGLSKEETVAMIDSLHRIQPDCLFSSRVGHDLGDYQDFGDSEIPPVPIKSAWEAIFTGNDSWGYIEHDLNFKCSGDIISLLANTASKGGNLMLNVGPDGKGAFPTLQVKYLAETGRWLKTYGESIYGTTYGLVPPQPWGVTTSKPGKLYLHVFRAPSNRTLRVPFIKASVKTARLLGSLQSLKWTIMDDALMIQLPPTLPDDRDAVLELEYNGIQPDFAFNHTQTVSRNFADIKIPVVQANYSGAAKNNTVTHSHYFGDWKHDNIVVGLKDTTDGITFQLNFSDTGEYKITLDYAASHEFAGQEGVVEVSGQRLNFLTLETGSYDANRPLLFLQQEVGAVHIGNKGNYQLRIRPAKRCTNELFWLRNFFVRPAK